MSVFSSVRGNSVGRSVFDLSHVKRFTCDMGQLIPVLFQECVPGDTFKIGMECVTRFQPLVAPILDSVDLTVHYFFIPTRLLLNGKDDWETFLSGGKDGSDDSVSLPLWSFHFFDGGNESKAFPFSNGHHIGKYSLWDYFGLPLGDGSDQACINIANKNFVLAFAQRCYNLVWNEYYRDQTLSIEAGKDNSTILYRSWKKDYFTSSLPWQQRGVAPALPVSGQVPVTLNSLSFSNFYLGSSSVPDGDFTIRGKLDSEGYSLRARKSGESATYLDFDKGKFDVSSVVGTADMSGATTFDIATLRQAMQVQRWMELNARGGVRYTEFLKSHFGVSPRDEVLQRPEYIGGTKSSVVVSEVLQTSRTVDSTETVKGSPQGNLAGHGLGATQDYISTYSCKEFGYILALASWMPKGSYQQGVPRSFSRRTRYDFYFPEFAHLSEQAVLNCEVYASGDNSDRDIFGYQSAYNELRSAQSINCADMRDTFKYWHLGRIFTSRPYLNSGFLTTNTNFSGGIRKDIFASPGEPGLIVQFGNLIKAIRPLPVYGTPGFMDHVGRM